jgi:uncharacterized protein YciI
MLHFMVEITYTVPFDVLSSVVPEHRIFLKTGYEKGWLLMSGPMNPRKGGIVIAKAPSIDELRAFFAIDPYAIKGLATYRYVEFDPVNRQAFMDSWVTG